MLTEIQIQNCFSPALDQSGPSQSNMAITFGRQASLLLRGWDALPLKLEPIILACCSANLT